jgi:GTP-binding protein YchF
MRIGLVGLPNSGKTTVFNALTKGNAATAAYSSGAGEINTLIVDVPDPRVDALVKFYQAKKTVYAKVEYSDIGGLRGDAERGLTLSGDQIGLIANNQALIHVVRAFEDNNAPHPLDNIDPQRDIDLLDSEFLLSDLSKIETRLPKLEGNMKRGKALPSYESDRKEFELLTRIQAGLEESVPIRDMGLTTDEQKLIRGFQFLTEKPIMILLNLGDEGEAASYPVEYPHQQAVISAIRGRLEMDLIHLDEEDAAIFMEEYGIAQLSLDRIIAESYQLLNRMVFFTAGEKEVHAWEAPTHATSLTCAGIIHSDLERGFIRAEVVHYDDLIQAGSEAAAKAAGKYRLEGREYIVQDGDILVIRFNI